MTATWPGDYPVETAFSARRGEADSVVNVGRWSTSTHNGTHADAPFHVDANGVRAEAFDAGQFVGPATVIDATRADVIDVPWLTRQAFEWSARLLFKTNDRVDPEVWYDSYPPLTVEAVDLMAERGCVVVGTDAPSVDPVDSKALSAHHAFVRNGVVNVENLMLNGVAPGLYIVVMQLIIIEGMDAAPVTASLFDGEDFGALADGSFPS